MKDIPLVTYDRYSEVCSDEEMELTDSRIRAGKKEDMTVKLRRVNGHWKILNTNLKTHY